MVSLNPYLYILLNVALTSFDSHSIIITDIISGRKQISIFYGPDCFCGCDACCNRTKGIRKDKFHVR